MELSIVAEYPTGTAFGADYFTRAARGEIIEEGPDGPVIRPELVVITDRYLDEEGQICVGERTIRHLAHRFGMVDGWRVKRVVDDNASLRAELVELSMQLAAARSELDVLREMELRARPTKYIGLDNTEHASPRAATEAAAKLLGVERQHILDAIPTPVDTPANKE